MHACVELARTSFGTFDFEKHQYLLQSEVDGVGGVAHVVDHHIQENLIIIQLSLQLLYSLFQNVKWVVGLSCRLLQKGKGCRKHRGLVWNVYGLCQLPRLRTLFKYSR